MQPPLVGFYPEVPDVSIEAEVLDGILHLLKHCQEELTLLGIQGSQLCTSVGNTWNHHNFGAGFPAALRITGSVCKCFLGVHGAGVQLKLTVHSPHSTPTSHTCAGVASWTYTLKEAGSNLLAYVYNYI